MNTLKRECETIAAIAQEDEYEVQNLLDKWLEYFPVKSLEVEGEIKYGVYHGSFWDYLNKRREIEAKAEAILGG